MLLAFSDTFCSHCIALRRSSELPKFARTQKYAAEAQLRAILGDTCLYAANTYTNILYTSICMPIQMSTNKRLKLLKQNTFVLRIHVYVCQCIVIKNNNNGNTHDNI